MIPIPIRITVPNPNCPHNKQKEARCSNKSKVVEAATIAGGVTGLVVAGPCLAVVGAIGAGVLATQNNKGGEIARASGDVVLAAGDRAKKIDEKHHVVSKTKKALLEFEEKHRLGEKVGNGVTKGLKFVSESLKPKDGK